MPLLEDFLQDVQTVAIAGHVNPDGDCIGACLGVQQYIHTIRPDIRTTVYLESYREAFSFLEGIQEAKSQLEPGQKVDLLILVDISSQARIGVAGPLLETAGAVLCFDHHITNTDDYTWLFNEPSVSSTCEVVFSFLDPTHISTACATALYTGIVHDTGVFRYGSTRPETLRMAALLMEKGVPFTRVLEETYYQKTFAQNQILAKALLGARLLLDGKMILSSITRQEREAIGVEQKDMDGIVSAMRDTIEVQVAVFFYELDPEVWKISLRSRDQLDVSSIAQQFGGGGHVRAAGCNLSGDRETVTQTLIAAFEEVFCTTA